MFTNTTLDKSTFLKALPQVKNKEAALHLASFVTTKEDVLFILNLFHTPKAAAKAAWVFSHACEKNPSIFEPCVSEMLVVLESANHKAVARSLLRSLNFCQLDAAAVNRLKEIAKAYLEDPHQAIAAKAFSLKLLSKYVESNTHEYTEVKRILTPFLSNASPGILAASKYFRS